MVKTPTPVKLPSGNWRIQICVDGKRYSFVDKDIKVVKQKAKEVFAGAQIEKRLPMTVGTAIDKYIAVKSGILSPSTILGYKRYRANYFQCIMDTRLSDLTQEDIQIAVSEDAASGLSPKNIRNAHGLLSAVLRMYRPALMLRTTLPEKQVYEVRIPTEEEIQKIWQAARGTRYELPILLGSWLGLRMSEIKGLKFSDLSGSQIHIQRAIVRGEKGSEVKKTKTVSGDRWITVPEEILNMIHLQPKTSDYICNYPSISIYKGFVRTCERAGVEPCRFHDLRHFAASEAHSLGVPDKYQMKRMGHKTDNMLKTVYQHTMRDKEVAFSNIIDSHMRELYLQ